MMPANVIVLPTPKKPCGTAQSATVFPVARSGASEGMRPSTFAIRLIRPRRGCCCRKKRGLLLWKTPQRCVFFASDYQTSSSACTGCRFFLMLAILPLRTLTTRSAILAISGLCVTIMTVAPWLRTMSSTTESTSMLVV